MTPTTTGSVAKLLDFLIAEHDLKNDSALAREMDRDTAYVSKLRHNRLRLSANVILFIHVHFGIGVQEIFERSGQQPGWLK